ncbi:BnaC09g11150D [Brassica napus]|uniref:BnaC09g11150D protein n=1 Tax=Brassica napus TaxID=3708 RepID=A0A078GG92_BRANA|nr:BnaC09g11150D [Brassica napus]
MDYKGYGEEEIRIVRSANFSVVPNFA